MNNTTALVAPPAQAPLNAAIGIGVAFAALAGSFFLSIAVGASPAMYGWALLRNLFLH